MFLLAHIEKFITENPTKVTKPEELLAKIREESKHRDPVGKFDSCQADEWLGEEVARDFFNLVETNPVYLKISTDWVCSSSRP